MHALLPLVLFVWSEVPAVAELPDELPPLDADLVDAPSPVAFFGQARLRGEFDDSRDFSRADDAAAGVALTGRVGIDAAFEPGRLLLVVGDGGRLGKPSTAPDLVPRPAIPQLFQVELVVDLDVAGLPTSLSFGRMPVTIADGRLVGSEPFDARGRTLDGVRARAALRAPQDGDDPAADVGLGLFLLGPHTADASDIDGPPSALLTLDASLRSSAAALDVYGLLHRDGPGGLTIPTAGARAHALLFGWLSLRAGADAQAPLVDGEAPLSPSGTAAHAEAGVRATAPLSSWGAPDLYLGLSGELTAGDEVKGRVFRLPAPSQHRTLGVLDLVALDNTWSTAAAVGAVGADGLRFEVSARAIGLVIRDGPLLDTAGAPLVARTGNGVALLELDARLGVPLGEGMGLFVDYGVALPGAALVGDQPAQRLLVTVWASTVDVALDRRLPRLSSDGAW